MLDLPSLPTLELPDELKLEEVRATPTPMLTVVTPKNRGWRQERLNGMVQFNYLGTLRARLVAAMGDRAAGRGTLHLA